MQTGITLFKLCLVLASNFGYWEYFRRKLKISPYFLPFFTIAAQFCVMFAAGLLNYLGDAVNLMRFGGLLLLAAELYWERGNVWKLLRPYFCPGYLLALLGFVAALVTLWGKSLSAIDNFTHWAVVVRNMVETNRFPTSSQDAVAFTTYPMGSAACIYYFCRMFSDAEWGFMLAQTYLMLCMILPLFAGHHQHPILSVLLVGLMGNLFLCCNIPITELLVDTLIPLSAAAAAAFLYRECLAKEDPLPLYYAFVPLFLLVNIKTSGAFFAAAALLGALVFLRRHQKGLKPLAIVVLLLLIGHSLWSRHCDYVFADVSVSPNAISGEYFRLRLAERTPADMLLIVKRAALYLATRRELGILVIWLAVLGVAVWLLNPQKKKQWLTLASVNACVYLAWCLSLMGMYVFSMGIWEATDLTSIQRYSRTIDIFLLYLDTSFALELLAWEVPRRRQLTAGAGFLLLAAVSWYGICGGFPLLTGTNEGDLGPRRELEALVEEYGVSPGYSYLICGKVASGYSMFALRYCMNTSRVEQIAVTEESQMKIEKDYDYIFLLDPDNPVLDSWVKTHYPQQYGRQVIQCIK